MKIKLNSVFVDDQEKALKFYTEVLGFMKKVNLPAGEYRWLTVVSPEEPDGTELLLEPNSNHNNFSHLQMNLQQQYHLAIDTTRFRDELGYIEPITEEEALQQTIAWEQENLTAINTRQINDE